MNFRTSHHKTPAASLSPNSATTVVRASLLAWIASAASRSCACPPMLPTTVAAFTALPSRYVNRRPCVHAAIRGEFDDAATPTTTAVIRLSSRLRARPKSKWDDLVDEDDDCDSVGGEIDGGNGDGSETLSPYGAPATSSSGSRAAAVPPDMIYTLPNIRRQAEMFDRLVEAGGTDIVNDVYVRASGKKEWWLVGRVARVSDVSPEKAIERQWPLIDRNVWALRLPVRHPTDPNSTVEVWYAPGDTELDAARNDPDLRFIQILPEKCEGACNVASAFVGFVGKAYGLDEPAFFVERNVVDGTPCGTEMEGDWIPKPPPSAGGGGQRID